MLRGVVLGRQETRLRLATARQAGGPAFATLTARAGSGPAFATLTARQAGVGIRFSVVGSQFSVPGVQ